MAKRPDVFDRQAFEQSLRRQGCPEGFVGPTVSDFKLFVPLILATLGEEKVFQFAEDARVDLGLDEQRAAWKTATKFIVGWANEQLETYRRQKERDGS